MRIYYYKEDRSASNAETRAVVIAAIEMLGYTPNAAAKSLRTLRSGRVLVTVPDIANPFFSLILQGIESAAQRAGYSVLLGDTQHDDTREQQYALMLSARSGWPDLPRSSAAQGGRGARAVAAARARAGRQRLRVQPQPARAQRAHRQLEGRVRGGRTSLPTGASIRHSRPMASPLSRDRLKGAMARARGHVGRQRRHPIESGIAAGDQLLSAASPPTGIFCFNDEMGIGVLHAARRCGLHVPSDLSVVSSTTSASRSTSIHR